MRPRTEDLKTTRKKQYEKVARGEFVIQNPLPRSRSGSSDKDGITIKDLFALNITQEDFDLVNKETLESTNPRIATIKRVLHIGKSDFASILYHL